jgi:hypothetical protein
LAARNPEIINGLENQNCNRGNGEKKGDMKSYKMVDEMANGDVFQIGFTV